MKYLKTTNHCVLCCESSANRTISQSGNVKTAFPGLLSFSLLSSLSENYRNAVMVLPQPCGKEQFINILNEE